LNNRTDIRFCVVEKGISRRKFVMFDVKKHLIKVQGGRQYLPVSARLVWFREEHPDWGIETKAVIIDTDKQFAIFEATVFDEKGKLMAKGTKMEDFRGFPDYIEKSETGAIGRALAVCGFGTQFAPDLDELDAGRFVDSPQLIRGGLDSQDTTPYGRSDVTQDASTGRPTNGQPRYGGPQVISPIPRQQSPVDRPQKPPTRPEYQPATVSAPPKMPSSWQNGERGDNNVPGHASATTKSSPEDDAPTHTCSACGRELKASQEALSMRKFGIGLCPICQKERQSVEAAG
jgi:hypothetical protein